MKKFVFLIAVITCFISCNQQHNTSANKTESSKKLTMTPVFETYEMDIEGMTCEIGCARTIESKLSKTKGVSYSKVDFESKKGTFTIDTTLINEQKVKEKIAGIAGGDLYSVVKSKKINKILK